MVRISKPPEMRRQEIIDAAARLFIQNGYENTTVRDIVHEVGVAQGLFYYYFKSKEEVFYALAQQYAQGLLTQINQDITKSDISPLERTRVAINGIARSLYDKDIRASRLPAELSPNMHIKVYQLAVDMVEPYLAKLLEEGMDQGAFAPANPLYTARFILSGFVGLATSPGAPGVEDLVDMLHTMIERMLALPRGSLAANGDAGENGEDE